MEFTVKKEDLKLGLGVAALSIGEKGSGTSEHVLFTVSENSLIITSTNRITISWAALAIQGGQTGAFTIDPKKLLSVINGSDNDTIGFKYDETTKTTLIYVSENKDDSLSMSSYETKNFLTFEQELVNAVEVKTLTAGVLLSGLKFIDGFLSSDSKDEKFSNVYISNGALYGSNGSTKIGVFNSPDLAGLDSLTIPKYVIGPIASMIDKVDMPSITLKTTSRAVMIFSNDNKYMYGFVRKTIPIPRFPASTDIPELPSFNINRTPWLRKMDRLATVSDSDLKLGMTINGNTIKMKTYMERASSETIECIPVNMPAESTTFIIEHDLLEKVLKAFPAPDVTMYIGIKHCIIRSEGKLSIDEKDQDKPSEAPFIAAGFITLTSWVGTDESK